MKDSIAFYVVNIPLSCCGSKQIVSETGSEKWTCIVCGKPAPSYLAREAVKNMKGG